jgi:hypothetical protein
MKFKVITGGSNIRREERLELFFIETLVHNSLAGKMSHGHVHSLA